MTDSTATLPIIDIDVFRTGGPGALVECDKAATAIITYGALILHDSRVEEEDNSAFLDLIEDYFAQPVEDLEADEHPEWSYQVGVTLENTEKPKCAVDEPCLKVIARLDPAERPLDISGHSPDPKCRFFWRMSQQPPYETAFPVVKAQNVVPNAPHIKNRWTPIMQQWGRSMKNAVEDVADMISTGLGVPPKTFSEAGRYGCHLLAPTASDLIKYGKKETILAGFHTDLNFLTIHGRSRYPGLNIWARNTGRRIPVKLPATGSYLLVQAGKQLEHITGGLIKAGFHEVVVNDATLKTIEARKAQFPDRPLIRVSSTFFWHLSADYDLVPIPELAAKAHARRADTINLGRTDVEEDVIYETLKVGQQVQNELKHIELMA